MGEQQSKVSTGDQSHAQNHQRHLKTAKSRPHINQSITKLSLKRVTKININPAQRKELSVKPSQFTSLATGCIIKTPRNHPNPILILISRAAIKTYTIKNNKIIFLKESALLKKNRIYDEAANLDHIRFLKTSSNRAAQNCLSITKKSKEPGIFFKDHFQFGVSKHGTVKVSEKRFYKKQLNYLDLDSRKLSLKNLVCFNEIKLPKDAMKGLASRRKQFLTHKVSTLNLGVINYRTARVKKLFSFTDFKVFPGREHIDFLAFHKDLKIVIDHTTNMEEVRVMVFNVRSRRVIQFSKIKKSEFLDLLTKANLGYEGYEDIAVDKIRAVYYDEISAELLICLEIWNSASRRYMLERFSFSLVIWRKRRHISLDSFYFEGESGDFDEHIIRQISRFVEEGEAPELLTNQRFVTGMQRLSHFNRFNQSRGPLSIFFTEKNFEKNGPKNAEKEQRKVIDGKEVIIDTLETSFNSSTDSSDLPDDQRIFFVWNDFIVLADPLNMKLISKLRYRCVLNSLNLAYLSDFIISIDAAQINIFHIEGEYNDQLKCLKSLQLFELDLGWNIEYLNGYQLRSDPGSELPDVATYLVLLAGAYTDLETGEEMTRLYALYLNNELDVIRIRRAPLYGESPRMVKIEEIGLQASYCETSEELAVNAFFQNQGYRVLQVFDKELNLLAEESEGKLEFTQMVFYGPTTIVLHERKLSPMGIGYLNFKRDFSFKKFVFSEEEKSLELKKSIFSPSLIPRPPKEIIMSRKRLGTCENTIFDMWKISENCLELKFYDSDLVLVKKVHVLDFEIKPQRVLWKMVGRDKMMFVVKKYGGFFKFYIDLYGNLKKVDELKVRRPSLTGLVGRPPEKKVSVGFISVGGKVWGLERFSVFKENGKWKFLRYC